MHATEVIIKPLITEKSTHQATARNTYAFHVSPKADKIEIKQAIEELYKVKVADVRCFTVTGPAFKSSSA